MTQAEFESQFVSKSALCVLLGKSLGYLDVPIKLGKIPKPLSLTSGGNKLFYLYERSSILENEFIKKQLGVVK